MLSYDTYDNAFESTCLRFSIKGRSKCLPLYVMTISNFESSCRKHMSAEFSSFLLSAKHWCIVFEAQSYSPPSMNLFLDGFNPVVSISKMPIFNPLK